MVIRRLIAGFTFLSVMTAVLASVATSSQAAAAVNPTVTPPAGQNAVKPRDAIRLGGTVDGDASGVNKAQILVKAPSGATLNTIPRPSTTISGGTIQGGTHALRAGGCAPGTDPGTPGCEEDLPFPEAHGGSVVFEVEAQFPGGPQTGVSNPGVRVDLQPPVLKEAEFSRTLNEIDVLFSEEIKHPQGDAGSDWRVKDPSGQEYPVQSVQVSGADRRTLVLSVPLDSDSAPLVEYVVQLPLNPTARQTYRDLAGHPLAINDAVRDCRCVVADDKIPPAVPVITGIHNGGTSAVGNDATPEVRLSNIRNGNIAQIYREKENPGGFNPSDDPLIGTARAGTGNTATVETCRDNAGSGQILCPIGPDGLPELGPDGTYTLYAVAKDPGENLSTGAASGTYRLDRLAPTPSFVGLSANGMSVEVVFNEPVVGLGANNQANWRIDNDTTLPTSVEGSGDRRKLNLAAAADPQVLIKWLGSPDTEDQAGNDLAPFNRNAFDGLAPFVHVTKPPAELTTSDDRYTIEGTTEHFASSVDIFQDTNGDGNPDGGAVASDDSTNTGADGVGSFSVSTPLNPDAENDFLVRATRTAGVPAPLQGPYAEVPTIIQDSIPPEVSVVAPVGGQALPGGRPFKIKWRATDASPAGALALPSATGFDAGPIKIEYSSDGGASYTTVAENAPTNEQSGNGEFDWEVPDISTGQALIRITATDEAENKGSAESGIFTIDADNPFFSAITKDASHVFVEFSEPVSGLVAAAEWRIAGTPAKSVAPFGSQSSITHLTLESLQPIGKSDTPEIAYGKVAAATQLKDRVDNEMSPSSAIANDGIPPGVPTVTDPINEVFTGQEKQSIKGGAEEGSLVTVYRDEGNDGTPDVEVGSQQLGPTETLYDVEATLQDGVNELLVVASDPAGNDSPGANVPKITADLVAPVVTIVEPNAGQLVGGGDQQFTVRWIAVDANLVQDSILIEFSTDGGASYQTIAQNEMNDGELSFPIANEAVKSAMIRVSARDTYDRVGTATSGAFEILVCEIFGTNGDDVLVGTDKGETICSYDGNDTVHGRGGNDTILSGSGRKKIDAGDGNDRVEGGPADDLIRGGSGDDDLNGRDGNDQVLGDDGRDVVIGFNGNDSLRGGTGNDRLLGQAGNDRLTGDSGNDTLSGAEGNDKARGGTGNDSLLGEAGNDQLRGDAGNDRVKGGDGNDRLIGGADDDRLDGMDGRDNLSGGSGNDRLSGGPGKDRCKPGSGANHVTRSC